MIAIYILLISYVEEKDNDLDMTFLLVYDFKI